MNVLLTKIGQLAIFLICAQTLVHFRPKDSYEKYIKLLVSMMLLILIVEPVMDLLGKGNQGAFMDRVQVYEQELQKILETPQLETMQIEVMIQDITRQGAEKGAAYVQKQEAGKQTVEEAVAADWELPVSNEAVKGEAGTATEDIAVQVEVEEIQEVKIGAGYGKTARNH